MQRLNSRSNGLSFDVFRTQSQKSYECKIRIIFHQKIFLVRDLKKISIIFKISSFLIFFQEYTYSAENSDGTSENFDNRWRSSTQGYQKSWGLRLQKWMLGKVMVETILIHLLYMMYLIIRASTFSFDHFKVMRND